MQPFPSVPVAGRAHGSLGCGVPGGDGGLVLHNIVSSGLLRRVSGLWRNTCLNSDSKECDHRTEPTRKKWRERWKKPEKVSC